MLRKSFNGTKNEWQIVSAEDAVHYPVEFVNTLKPPGLPTHKLILRVDAPVILLRNLHPPKLWNGSRLQIKALHHNVIEATILTGCVRGESVFVPRIPLIPSNFPFQFKWLQFSSKVCFAMTLNKSQGQTLKFAGVYLREDCFSLDQFYVPCSRVRSPSSLVVQEPEGTTKNVLHKEVR